VHGLSPNFHIHVSVSDLYVPRIGPHISLQQNWQNRSWKYINLSQIYSYECRNWETEHYNSVLEITISFLGIQKWEPDIYIGFSPALHLQCGFFTACHYTNGDFDWYLVYTYQLNSTKLPTINVLYKLYRVLFLFFPLVSLIHFPSDISACRKLYPDPLSKD
jgi:hypothetical protein